MVALALYTHSDYNDCWKPFFDRQGRHCSFEFDNHYIFSDDTGPDVDDKFEHIGYDDLDSYTDRVASCLRQVADSHILFAHEDMMLYDDIHEAYFNECIQVSTSDDVDCIKLIKGGSPKDTAQDIKYKGSDVLNYTGFTFDYIFAIQPTIWRVDSFLRLLENNRKMNIWEFETHGQEHCRTNRYNCLYTNHVDDKKRGMLHWDSVTYPYIATAVYKGKWVTSQYPDELKVLFSEYGIDPAVRGEM